MDAAQKPADGQPETVDSTPALDPTLAISREDDATGGQVATPPPKAAAADQTPEKDPQSDESLSVTGDRPDVGSPSCGSEEYADARETSPPTSPVTSPTAATEKTAPTEDEPYEFEPEYEGGQPEGSGQYPVVDDDGPPTDDGPVPSDPETDNSGKDKADVDSEAEPTNKEKTAEPVGEELASVKNEDESGHKTQEVVDKPLPQEVEKAPEKTEEKPKNGEGRGRGAKSKKKKNKEEESSQIGQKQAPEEAAAKSLDAVRPKQRQYGYDHDATDSTGHPLKVVKIKQVKNYMKMYFAKKLNFNYYASLISGEYPKFLRMERGARRYRMRYNIFVDGVFVDQSKDKVMHIGELHLFMDLVQRFNGIYQLNLKDYQRYTNQDDDPLLDKHKRLDAENEWRVLVDDIYSMKQLKKIERHRFSNPDERMNMYLTNNHHIYNLMFELNSEYQHFLERQRRGKRDAATQTDSFGGHSGDLPPGQSFGQAFSQAIGGIRRGNGGGNGFRRGQFSDRTNRYDRSGPNGSGAFEHQHQHYHHDDRGRGRGLPSRGRAGPRF